MVFVIPARPEDVEALLRDNGINAEADFGRCAAAKRMRMMRGPFTKARWRC